MADLNELNQNLLERLVAMETRVEERDRRLEEKLDRLSSELREHAAQSARDRLELSSRLHRLEKNADIDAAIQEAKASAHSKWLIGLLWAIKYLLPPSLGGAVALWLWERFNG